MNAIATPGYPAEWETTAILKDGATVQIRPIVPEDRDLLARFHSRQSQESIYFRFFRYRPELSEQELTYFTEIDYADRMALIAVLGDEMVAVARYEKSEKNNTAEVAFFVDDAHHGRGLATLMLEYLAEAGRQMKFSGFTATVLSENYRMLRVFRHAGFEVSTRFADGVIEVDLGLDPTPETLTIIEDRDRMARVESVRRVFSPTSVTVIGASRTPGTVGHEFVRSVVGSGFSGPITAVNLNVSPDGNEQIAGASAVPSVSAVTSAAGVEKLDLVVISVPAPEVLGVAQRCIDEGARTLLIAAGGFSEEGGTGLALERSLVELARKHGVRLVGPLSYGLINTDPDALLSCEFFPVEAQEGDVALLSQSGPLGAAVLGHLNDKGVGISTFLSLGNRADLSPGDLLEFWAEDDRTKVGALYLENLGNPQKFITTGRRVSRRKPVVSLRPTNQQLAVVAEAAGLIMVDGVSELLDQVRLIDAQPAPLGNRVAIITNMPSVGRLAAVACVRADLDLTADETIAANATVEEFESLVVATAVADNVDSVIVAISPTLALPGRAANSILSEIDRAVDKPVVAVNLTGFPAKQGPPVFAFPEEAVQALGRYVAYSNWLAAADSPELTSSEVQREALAALVEGILQEGEAGGSEEIQLELGSTDAQRLFDAAGVSVAETRRATSASEALAAANELGYPVGVKATWIRPRTPGEAGGTVLDLKDSDLLARVLGGWDVTDSHPVLVQQLVPSGVHVALCVEQRPDQGSTLSLSLGGAAAAGLEPLSWCVLPATDAEVQVAVSKIPGLSEAAMDQLRWFVSEVARVSAAALEIGRWDMNPVLVSDNSASAVEASVTLRRWPEDPLGGVRHL